MANIFITAAITGSIHLPVLSPYLPITEQQIIDDAVAACEAGAAVVHIHARNPENGQPSVDKELLKAVLSGIKERCAAVICLTGGAGLGMSLEERASGQKLFRPEIGSCNVGSFNFNLAPLGKKCGGNYKYPWEGEYVDFTDDFAMVTTFKQARYLMQNMYDQGTVPEVELYDLGMINNLAYLKGEGVLKGPLYVQFVLGILGGLPASVDNLLMMVNTAKKQLGDDFFWSCAGAGKEQLNMAAVTLALGGNVRVGLEDNLYLRRGVLAKSSAEQVAGVRQMAELMGHTILGPDEARAHIGLKGKNNVNF